jgi:hypothetical protein
MACPKVIYNKSTSRIRFIIGLLAGIMFTHPHEYSPSAMMLFIIAHDQSGLERAARLFPTRTGLALADWLVVGKRADKQGAYGIEKAGYEMKNLSNLRQDLHLTFHNLQTLGTFLGIPQ